MTKNEYPMTIGIVGLGSRAQLFASDILESGHHVVGTDVHADARSEFEREFNVTTYKYLQDMYNSDVDGVIIATPNKYHEEPAIRAFEKDLDVLIEKPLADNLQHAVKIAEEAEDSDGICHIGFHNRYWNACKVLKAYIEDGYFGEITNLEANYVRRRGIPGKGSWMTSKELAGGGALLDIGIHVIDLIHHLLGHPELDSVAGAANRVFGQEKEHQMDHPEAFNQPGEDRLKKSRYNVEDTIALLLKYVNDTVCTINIAWASNCDNRHEYIIRGTKAGARLEINEVTNSQQLHFFRANDRGAEHYIDSVITIPENNARKTVIEQFLTSIDNREDTEKQMLDEALEVQKTVERIYNTITQEGNND